MQNAEVVIVGAGLSGLTAARRTKAQGMGHTLHHQGLDVDAELLRAERHGLR